MRGFASRGKSKIHVESYDAGSSFDLKVECEVVFGLRGKLKTHVQPYDNRNSFILKVEGMGDGRFT